MSGLGTLPHPPASLSRVRHAEGRQVRKRILVYLGLLPFVIVAMFPVIWMAVTAFKQDADLVNPRTSPFWFGVAPTLHHFAYLFQNTQYGYLSLIHI